MNHIRYLKIKERAHQFTLAIFKAVEDIPTRETGLINRIKLEAISISGGITNGLGRGNYDEANLLLLRAIDASNKLEYLLLLDADLECLSGESHQRLKDELVEIRRLLARYVQGMQFFTDYYD